MEPAKKSGGLFEDEDDLFTPALEDPLTSKSGRVNENIDLIGGINDEMSINDVAGHLRLEGSQDSTKLDLEDDDEIGHTRSGGLKASGGGVNGILENRLESCSLTDVDMDSGATVTTPNKDDVAYAGADPCTQVQEERESEQQRISIEIEKFERRGEGVSSYVAYMVVCKIPPTVPGFSKREHVTWRRFSDFLGLHDTLSEKYLMHGRIIPPAPAKNVIGMTKAKMIKGTFDEDPVTSEFLERRRASLERYLRRTAAHPVLQADPYFRTFVTLEDELPRASQTAVLSSSTIKRLWDRVSDGLNKYAVSRMDGNDAWFNEKQYEVEQLEMELRKLLNKAESLVTVRREYAGATEHFCKCLSVLTACEENTSLSRALSLLCETMEKISQLQNDQADKDFYVLFETLKDYIALIDVVKEVFFERTKVWNCWQTALQTLAKKRDSKSRFEMAGKTERVPQALKEVEEWEQKSTEAEKHFASISSIIQKEYGRFEQQRIKEFKHMLIYELESIANTQQQLTKLWEAFIPDAQAIL